MDFDPLLEKIVIHFTGPQFAEDVQSARQEFFENAGVLDETAQDFEQRMALFLDWYCFSRELKGHSRRPIEAVETARELRFNEEEQEQLERLTQVRHSLYMYVKTKKDRIYLKDLFTNSTVSVIDTGTVIGLNPDEVVEARLVPVGDDYVFLKGFCFHPMEAKKFILKEAKLSKKDPSADTEAVMLRLMKMKYRFDQYRHVSFEAIYKNDRKVKA